MWCSDWTNSVIGSIASWGWGVGWLYPPVNQNPGDGRIKSLFAGQPISITGVGPLLFKAV